MPISIDPIKHRIEIMQGIKASIDAIEDETMKQLCTSFLEDVTHELAQPLEHYSNPREQTDLVAMHFANLSICLSGYYAGKVARMQEDKRRPAQITNDVAGLRADVARVIAKGIWDADATRQEFLMQDTARQVLDILERNGNVKPNSITLRTVKDWIRPIAPEYAKAPGAPKKQ